MTERRIQSRCLCAEMVKLNWQGGTADAVLEDISPFGGCVQLEFAIPLGSPVTLSIGQSKYPGHVCYCVYREIGYFVGLRFCDDKVWSPDEVVPQHLLNLETLVRAAQAAKSVPD